MNDLGSSNNNRSNNNNIKCSVTQTWSADVHRAVSAVDSVNDNNQMIVWELETIFKVRILTAGYVNVADADEVLLLLLLLY